MELSKELKTWLLKPDFSNQPITFAGSDEMEVNMEGNENIDLAAEEVGEQDDTAKERPITPVEKTVYEARITERFINDRLYYYILYYPAGGRDWCDGFGSYNFGIVRDYLNKYFNVIGWPSED